RVGHLYFNSRNIETRFRTLEQLMRHDILAKLEAQCKMYVIKYSAAPINISVIAHLLVRPHRDWHVSFHPCITHAASNHENPNPNAGSSSHGTQPSSGARPRRSCVTMPPSSGHRASQLRMWRDGRRLSAKRSGCC